MNGPIEKYLKRVRLGLWTLTSAQRSEELSELRAHLVSLAETFQEGGQSALDAEHTAVRQLGPSDAVCLRLRAAYGRGWFLRHATTLPGMMLLATLVLMLPQFMNDRLAYRIPSPDPTMPFAVHVAVGLQEQVLFYLLAGMIAGYVSLRRALVAVPAAGIASTLLLSALPSNLAHAVPSLLFFGMSYGQRIAITSHWDSFLFNLPMMLQAYTGWTLVGLAGAVMGGLLRSRTSGNLRAGDAHA